MHRSPDTPEHRERDLEDHMNTTIGEANMTRVIPPHEMTELVRGTDHVLVATVEPMVRQQDVMLDLDAIQRIDAAGIAALISLYGAAHEAGHRFEVCNVAPRIDEILRLVGLEAILVCHHAIPMRSGETCLEQSAA